jgi:Amt family ammonium transporter
MKFIPFMIFVAIWTTVVYDTIAHWIWSFKLEEDGTLVPAGWMGVKGKLDFAGGSVIHIPSGFAALACALVLGKRQGYGEEVKPHNLPLVIIGAALLWFGWFGFNAGSAGGATGLASVAFLNTHLAAASAALSWMMTERIFAKKITPSGAAAGIVAGLVAITPAAGFVDVWTSLIFGLVVSPICYGAAKLKGKIGIDDTLDCFALHGVGGIVGAFMTGLFATKNINFANGSFYGNPEQVGWQLVGVIVSAAFSFVVSLLIMLGLKYTIGVRVSEDIEKEGIDVSEHGGKSYAH